MIKWLKNLEEGVEVEVREENQVTRDRYQNAHSDGRLVVQKERGRIPRFKTKLEELIWKAEQKVKK
jgi:hypothetical protein